MEQYITNLVSNWPPELSTFFLSMTPIGELRLAIPWAVKFYHFSISKAFIISFIGNNLINFMIYFLALPIANWFEGKENFIGKIVDWVRHHALKKGEKYIEKYGSWGIFIIALIPLPGFGGWTGSLIAAFLGIKHKKAVPALVGGTLVAAIIVTVSVLGVMKAW